jgi:hypothetical protein
MNANIYEKTYVSVKNAVHDTQHLDAVVEFLRKQSEPVTCATIGEAVFGDQYHSYYMGKSCQGMMGQMLRHLRQGGFIKMEERKGDTIEIEVEGWISEPDVNGESPTIIVHDDKGREYTIKNPNYGGDWHRRGHWGMVKKTVTPTIKTYIWVA